MDPDASATTAPSPNTSPNTSPHIQQRLLQLTGQLDQMQRQLEQITGDTQENNAQLEALLRAMLSAPAPQSMEERLVELTGEVAATHEQIEQIRDALAALATQEQVSALERALAGRDIVADVADSVKKLGRTQFKANTLGETREQQIESALALARELVVRREQIQERRADDERRRLDEVRAAARGEFAADLLPALDSIEMAIEAGRSLLARHRQQVEGWRAHYAAMSRAWEMRANNAEITRAVAIEQPPGFWERLRRSLAGEMPSAPAALPPTEAPPAEAPPTLPVELEVATDLLEATASWLAGLGLVRDRFAALLAVEEIQPLPALGKPFDPRLHLAIETEERRDAPANTVVRVLRQGYRQRQRVLRYAEVVVARPPSTPSLEQYPNVDEEIDNE